MDDIKREETKRQIFKAIELLPDKLDNNEIVSTALTVLDAYAEDDAELMGMICMVLAVFCQINKYSLEQAITLINVTFKVVAKQADYKEKMN